MAAALAGIGREAGRGGTIRAAGAPVVCAGLRVLSAMVAVEEFGERVRIAIEANAVLTTDGSHLQMDGR